METTMSPKGGRKTQMDSVRLSIEEQLRAAAEDILSVLDKRQHSHDNHYNNTSSDVCSVVELNDKQQHSHDNHYNNNNNSDVCSVVELNDKQQHSHDNHYYNNNNSDVCSVVELNDKQQHSHDNHYYNNSDVCSVVELNVRVFVVERLRVAAVWMCNLFQRETETLETLLEKQNKLLETILQPQVQLHRTDDSSSKAESVKEESDLREDLGSLVASGGTTRPAPTQGEEEMLLGGPRQGRGPPTQNKEEQQEQRCLPRPEGWRFRQRAERYTQEETSVLLREVERRWLQIFGSAGVRPSQEVVMQAWEEVATDVSQTSGISRSVPQVKKHFCYLRRSSSRRNKISCNRDQPVEASVEVRLSPEDQPEQQQSPGPAQLQEENHGLQVKEQQEETLQRAEEADAGSALTVAAFKDGGGENTETEAVAPHVNTHRDTEDGRTSPPSGDDLILSDTEVSDWEKGRAGVSAFSTQKSHKTPPIKRPKSPPSNRLSQDPKSSSETHKLTKKHFTCTICGKGLRSATSLKLHTMTHTGSKPFACTVCDKRFRSTGDFKRHMRTHTGEKPYLCTICGKAFAELQSLKGHMRTHTRENDLSGTAKKHLICTVCGKMFEHKSGLKSHAVMHTAEKLLACTVCDKRFGRRQHLKTHMLVHTREKRCVCNLCGKAFAHTQSLKVHTMTHTGERPFTCTLCGHSFINSSNLKSHMVVHTGEKPFACTICGKFFSTKKSLKSHMRIHAGEKPVSCITCGKGFSKTSHLKRHMWTHTGERPFTCTICGKGCIQKAELETHLKSHTG